MYIFSFYKLPRVFKAVLIYLTLATRTGQKTGIDMLLTELKITIPDSLPDVLKAYAKAAMRTQPPDLLRWSGLYFRSLAIGEKLPVKDRLEDPIKTSKDGLSPGILRVFDNIVRIFEHYSSMKMYIRNICYYSLLSRTTVG